jgi:hypothetical protein
MPRSGASRWDTSPVQFVGNRTEAPPFVAQLHQLALEGQSGALRLFARSLDRLRSRHGNIGIPELRSARLGSQQRCADSLGYASTMLKCRGRNGRDRQPTCFRHVQRHEFDVLFLQSINKGSAPVNRAEPRYHQHCIMTLGALYSLVKMRPSTLMRSLIFSKFVDQHASAADETPHGLGLCQQGSIPATPGPAAHSVVGHILTQGTCPDSSVPDRRFQG